MISTSCGLRHVAVAGGFEPALFVVEIETLSDRDVETAADQIRQWRQSLHERLHRDHHHAPGQARHAVQGRESLRDDVRMR